MKKAGQETDISVCLLSGCRFSEQLALRVMQDIIPCVSCIVKYLLHKKRLFIPMRLLFLSVIVFHLATMHIHEIDTPTAKAVGVSNVKTLPNSYW